jgi:hypothetical protein
MTIFLFAVFALFLRQAQQTQQPEPPATASLEGVVVKVGTNEPIPGVDVELSRVEGTARSPVLPNVMDAFANALSGGGPGGQSPPPLLAPEIRYARTSDDGKFAFKDLKEGKYRLAAARIGGTYYPAEYGQRDVRGRGVNIPLGVDQAMRNVRVEMAPTSAISGRILDEDGEPLGHVTVMALDPQYRQGQPRLYVERSVQSDEHGVYRLYWLGPGPHVVAAVIEDPRRRNRDLNERPPGRTSASYRASAPVITRRVAADGTVTEETSAVVYYPSILDSRSARVISLRPGETADGLDISMGVGRTPSYHIRGVVIDGVTGQPAKGAEVLAIPKEWRPNAHALSATADSNGVFDLAGAVTDSYVLTASAAPNPQQVNLTPDLLAAVSAAGLNLSQLLGTAPSQIAYMSLEVGGTNMDNVRVVTNPGVTIPGRVSIEGPPGDTPVDLSKMTVAPTRDPDLILVPGPLMPLPPQPRPAAGAPAAGAPAAQRPNNGQVTATGEFSLFISEGDFKLALNGVPPNMYIKSMRLGGANVLTEGLHVKGASDNALEIVLAPATGVVAGEVADPRSGGMPNVVVALVPDLPELRNVTTYYKSATTDFNGRFRLNGVPPGDYKLFAWEYTPPDSWQSTDFIRPYENSGKRVRVEAGGNQEGIQLTAFPKR